MWEAGILLEFLEGLSHGNETFLLYIPTSEEVSSPGLQGWNWKDQQEQVKEEEQHSWG